MKSLLFIALLFALPAALRADPPENPLVKKLSAPGKESVAALDTVLKSDTTSTSRALLLASGVAFREKRLEDAAYLMYIAELRFDFDNGIFLMREDTGGDDPGEAFSALQEPVGNKVNPAIMLQPKLFAKVLDRVKAWNPASPDEHYDPGWVYATKAPVTAAGTALEKDKAAFAKSMGDLCTLLGDPAYFAAFKICQAYNLETGKSRPSQKKYDDNFAILKSIENEKGMEGFAAQNGAQPDK